MDLFSSPRPSTSRGTSSSGQESYRSGYFTSENEYSSNLQDAGLFSTPGPSSRNGPEPFSSPGYLTPHNVQHPGGFSTPRSGYFNPQNLQHPSGFSTPRSGYFNPQNLQHPGGFSTPRSSLTSFPPPFFTPQPVYLSSHNVPRGSGPLISGFDSIGVPGPNGYFNSPNFQVPGSSASHSRSLSTPASRAPRTPRTPRSASVSSETPESIVDRTPMTPSSVTGRSRRSCDLNTVLAVIEGRGQARGEVGIAVMNKTTPSLILCQFTDIQNYAKVLAKISIFRPHEILMSSASCDTDSSNRLHQQLTKEAPQCTIVAIQRRIFNSTNGLSRINTLVAESFKPVANSVARRYYCLAAANALLKYFEVMHNIIFASKSLKLEFQLAEKTCLIDSNTAKNLELLQNNANPNSKHSLLGILNSCRTPAGSRLLRMNILQPSCDANVINKRLDCVEELMNSTEALTLLGATLSRVPFDLEQVLATLIQIPKVINKHVIYQRIDNIIALKHTIEMNPLFMEALDKLYHPYFMKMKSDFQIPTFDVLLEKITSVLNEEAKVYKSGISAAQQRLFAVRQDVNPILDMARQAYFQIIDDVNEEVNNFNAEYDLSVRLAETTNRGYYLEHHLLKQKNNSAMPNLPEACIQVKRQRNVISFTTEAILVLNRRVREVKDHIENTTHIIISELLVHIRKDISSVYKVSDAISHLDVLYSLGMYSKSLLHSCRPIFSPVLTSIAAGRHPVLESIGQRAYTPNDVVLSNYTNIHILFGPNMSGKTTFLKQFATLQVLAQIGCLIPAESASIRLADCIFSRIGNSDSIDDSTSSFQTEMGEMMYIINSLTPKSIVVVDELCRSTSITDGSAIAWTVVESLKSSKAFVLFSTHFRFLVRMESMYYNITNYRMETEQLETENGIHKLRYTHKISPGISTESNYGLSLASTTSIPKHILVNAQRIANDLAAQDLRSFATPEQKYERNCYLIAAHLRVVNAHKHTMDRKDFINHLKTYQTYLRNTRALDGRPSGPPSYVSRETSTQTGHTNENAVDVDDDQSSQSSTATSKSQSRNSGSQSVQSENDMNNVEEIVVHKNVSCDSSSSGLNTPSSSSQSSVDSRASPASIHGSNGVNDEADGKDDNPSNVVEVTMAGDNPHGVNESAHVPTEPGDMSSSNSSSSSNSPIVANFPEKNSSKSDVVVDDDGSDSPMKTVIKTP